jgi:hypothetical protein
LLEKENVSYFSDPKSIAFFYMMYAGVDVDANPDYAKAALTNKHLPLTTCRADLGSVLDVDQLPSNFTEDGFFDVQRRLPTSTHAKAAEVPKCF